MLRLEHRPKTHRGQHNQAQNSGGPNEKPNAKDARKDVNVSIECVGDHDNNGRHNAGDVHSQGNVLGVIETFDFDLADGEGKYQGNDLKQHFVAIENG